MHGVATPWCGHLVGKVEPAACSLRVLPSHDPDTAAVCDTLELRLVKAATNRTLWRAPFPELLAPLDLKERRAPRARRDALNVGGYDTEQSDGGWTITLPFKAGVLENDDFRVAVTKDAISVYIAGQEDAPMVAGQCGGALDLGKCAWRVRHAKPMGTMKIDEIVITIAKADPDAYWGDLFKTHYV